MADLLPSTDPSQPTASSSTSVSPSSSSRPLCSICNHRYSIYTCPRCSTRTCSLPCSTTHKSSSGCTGERNKVAFVPMNQYGWGSMMDDYVFLEDVGRRVGDWGREIVRGGFGMRGSAGRGRGGRGGDVSGRGRGRGAGNGHAAGRTKRDVLKQQLENCDIDMDLLPAGMARRNLNQSNWDFKNKTALLTIEFKFHRPLDLLAPSSQPRDPPFVMLTHRNSMEVPLITLIQDHVSERTKSKKDGACPAWVKSLVCPDLDDPTAFTPPQCVMTAQLDPVLSGPRPKAGYYQFDTTRTLADLLRKTEFVEFPTLEIWEEFRGTIVDTQGTVTRQDEDERKPKRRKLDPKAGRKAISGLLGGYGSDEDEEPAETQNVLSLLGGYAGSDDDEDNEADGDPDADAEGETDDELEMEPAVLLDLMRQVQGTDQWTRQAVEEDVVDWGDSGEDE